jgi:hypothetical protein
LVIVTRQPALSVFTAALVAAAARVADSRRSEAELREGTIPTTELQSWNRPAPETAPSADRLSPNESQGRWLWLGVLALLALEALARRNRRVPEQTKDDAIAA